MLLLATQLCLSIPTEILHWTTSLRQPFRLHYNQGSDSDTTDKVAIFARLGVEYMVRCHASWERSHTYLSLYGKTTRISITKIDITSWMRIK